MDSNDPFSKYFSSALQKKKVPVTVTTDPASADYTVEFQPEKNNGSVIRGVTNAIQWGRWDSGAYNEVSMQVVDPKTKDVTFSYTCRKPEQFTADDNRRLSSVAECLAKHWKNKLPK